MKKRFLPLLLGTIAILGLSFNLASCETNNKNTIQINKNKEITITFKNNTNEKYSPLKVYSGSILKKPFDPSKENATFLYWAVEKNGNLEEFKSFNKPIFEDIELIAVFKETKIFQVVLYAEGVNGFPTTNTPYNVKETEFFKTPKATPTPDNTYKFLGWYTDDKFINKFEEGFLTSNLNLYAKIVKKEKFNVTFKNPGVAGFNEVVKQVYEGLKLKDVDVEVSAPKGKIFKEWLIENTDIPFSFETPITSNINLVPNFVDISGNEEANVEKYTYELDGEEYVITGIKNRNENILYLPGLYQGKKVTKIKVGAFENYSTSLEVVLNENTKEIGENAFKDSKVIKVNFKNVEKIGDSAFENASSLFIINLPDTLKTIGNKAFKEASNLRYIDLGKGVKSIGEEAFVGTLPFGGTIYIPISVEKVETNAFKYNFSNSGWGWTSFFDSNKKHNIFIEASEKPVGFKADFYSNANVFYNSIRVVINYNTEDKIVAVTGTQAKNKVKKPEAARYKEGVSKEIIGWYTDPELATEFTFDNLDKSVNDVNSEINLYAKWSE